MSKEYFVIRGSKIIYSPGHYTEQDATIIAKTESRYHPKAVVKVVKVISQWQNAPDK